MRGGEGWRGEGVERWRGVAYCLDLFVHYVIVHRLKEILRQILAIVDPPVVTDKLRCCRAIAKSANEGSSRRGIQQEGDPAGGGSSRRGIQQEKDPAGGGSGQRDPTEGDPANGIQGDPTTEKHDE